MAYSHIWVAFIDFAEDVQYAVRNGWTFTRTYGERRLDIDDTMIFAKGEETVTVYGEGDLRSLCERIGEEKEGQTRPSNSTGG